MASAVSLAKNKIERYSSLFNIDLPSLYKIPDWYTNNFTVLSFPPPSITFYPFDLDSIQVSKDIIPPLYQEDRYQMIRYDTVISTKAYIFLWRNVDTGHKLNNIKLTVTNCSKYVSKDKAGLCTYCKNIQIGIYRFTGSTAGNAIWISLREAQHLVHVLTEFVDLMTKL
jgi:hypothetical protein